MLYKISCRIFEILIRILFRIQISGREHIPDAPYIVVPNHSSLLDPPLVGMVCKKNEVVFMAKEELFNIPVIGTWTRRVGCIKVERDSNNIKSLKEALRRIDKKKVVCIFPEGTRSIDGSLQEAKRGVGFLIAKAGVPVVPIYIKGSREAWPKGGRLIRGSRIYIRIGKALMTDVFLAQKDTGKEYYTAITDTIMNHIAILKEEMEKQAP